MKKLLFMVFFLSLGVVMGIMLDGYFPAASPEASDETAMEHAEKHLDPNYVCPMHSQIVSGEQGSCPICGMDLVAIKTTQSNDDQDAIYPTVRVSSTMINNMGVRVAQVERKTLVRQIETPGFIKQIRKEKYTHYKAPAKGRVAKFYFKPGQWLEPGDPLIDIELDDLVLVQEKHLALLEKENQQKKNKENESREDLVHRQVNDTTSDSLNAINDEKTSTEPVGITADETKSNATVIVKKTVEISTEKTRLLMKAAGMTAQQINDLEETRLTSPVITLYAKHAGEVDGLRVSVGDEVKANSLLFSLGGLMRVTVLANAFQRDASWVKPGQEVDIILPHDSNKSWKGRVSSGAVSINITSQNIGVELVFNAPNSVVKSGMYVVGNIYGQVQENTLTLPREAIIYSRNEKRVIVALGEGRFKPVVVETGISNENEIEILNGIEEGDTVVVSAQFLIDSESSLQASYRRMTSVE